MGYHLTMSNYRDYLDNAKRMKEDKDEDYRLKSQQCLWCFYKRTLAGAAFTSFECKTCGKKCTHSNTACPKLCRECAVENECCQTCGHKMFTHEDAYTKGPVSY